ncbi:hypothetical protein P6166_12710 [Stenotrophomonas sp. HITSZ_GD]|nr:hypothetical protein [Stenotrophomonas sp. HITSZ_GD]MDG2526216.1 hypothetical protein [Stenotrophomonas sp. HITSZ_GD]
MTAVAAGIAGGGLIALLTGAGIPYAASLGVVVGLVVAAVLHVQRKG